MRFVDERGVTSPSATEDIAEEFYRAVSKFPSFNSAHEGYAVLKEEVDELWEEIKKKPDLLSKSRIRAEAVQVAAMALRFIVDVCDNPKKY